jgi:peptidyl-prolyl cis-trans isomerase SurA
LICVLTMLCCCTITHARIENRMVATVGNHIITSQQLQNSINEAKAMLTQHKQQPPSDGKLRTMMLQQMINETIQLQFAKARDIKASQEETDQFIENVAAENKQSPADIITMLTDSGYSPEQARQKMQDQWLLVKTQRMVIAPQVAITPAQTKQIQQQFAAQQPPTSYHLGDLLIALPEQPTAAQHDTAQQQAKHLRQQALSQSVSLEQLAQQQPATSPAHFSDLGVRPADDIPDAFQPALSLQTSDISQPIAADNGIHVLQMLARHDAQTMSAQQAYQWLYQQQFTERLTAWIETLRADSYIDIKA